MKTTVKKLLSFFLTIIFVFTLIPASSYSLAFAASGEPTIALEGAEVIGKSGATFTVNLVGKNLKNCQSGVIHLTYDKNKLECILPNTETPSFLPELSVFVDKINESYGITGISCAFMHLSAFSAETIYFAQLEFRLLQDFAASEKIKIDVEIKDFFGDGDIISVAGEVSVVEFKSEGLFNLDDDGKIMFLTETGKACEFIEIPESVTGIQTGAFNGENNLKQIYILPKSINIEPGAFEGCENLEKIIVGPGVTNYTDINGVLFSKNGDKLIFYPPASKQVFFDTGKLRDFYNENENIFVNIKNLRYLYINTSFNDNAENIINILKDVEYLEGISVSPANARYSSKNDGVLFTKDGKFLIFYPPNRQGEYYRIPSNVDDIHKDAFSSSKNLETLQLSKNTNDSYGKITNRKPNPIDIRKYTPPAGQPRLNLSEINIYYYPSSWDIVLTLSLNGNTLGNVSGTSFDSKTDYDFAGTTFTIKKSYVDKLKKQDPSKINDLKLEFLPDQRYIFLGINICDDGDVDDDKRITAADARLVLRAAAKQESLTQKQKEAADVNYDGEITAADARTILRVSARLEGLPADI